MTRSIPTFASANLYPGQGVFNIGGKAIYYVCDIGPQVVMYEGEEPPFAYRIFALYRLAPPLSGKWLRDKDRGGYRHAPRINERPNVEPAVVNAAFGKGLQKWPPVDIEVLSSDTNATPCVESIASHAPKAASVISDARHRSSLDIYSDIL